MLPGPHAYCTVDCCHVKTLLLLMGGALFQMDAQHEAYQNVIQLPAHCCHSAALHQQTHVECLMHAQYMLF